MANIGVGEQQPTAARFAHPAGHRVTLACPTRRQLAVAHHAQSRNGLPQVIQNDRCGITRVVVHDDDLGDLRLSRERLQSRGDVLLLIARGQNDGERTGNRHFFLSRCLLLV
jgi:hypothetical protein